MIDKRASSEECINLLADLFDYSCEELDESKLRDSASEIEVKNTLKKAISNLEIGPDQKESLFSAFWENFEHFEMVSYG